MQSDALAVERLHLAQVVVNLVGQALLLGMAGFGLLIVLHHKLDLAQLVEHPNLNTSERANGEQGEW